MRLNSINRNVLQLAASNWQLASSTGKLATGKWMLTTGCLQTFAGKKLLDSKGSNINQSKGPAINIP